MVELIIDGKSLAESVPGTTITSKPTIPAATRDVKTTAVPGRKRGSLTQKLGWLDVSWAPTLTLTDFKKLNDSWRKTKAILQGASKLAFSDDPGYYYLIKSVTVGEFTPDATEVTGTYKPTFVLDPLQYVDADPAGFSNNFDLNNPGNEVAEPLLKVTGTGTVQLSFNSNVFSIDSVTAEVTIDSQAHTVTMGGKDITSSTKGPFPELSVGTTHVVLSNVTSITVADARWCYV